MWFVDDSSTHTMLGMDDCKVMELAVSCGICACMGDHVLERVEELQSCDWILHFRGVEWNSNVGPDQSD